MAVADEANDVAAVRRVLATGGEPLRERLTSRDRLQAADVAASADHVGAVRRPDVADVAGRAAGAAVDVPVGDDAAADPGADLDEQQVVGRAPVDPVLAAGHDVDVVVDEDRRAVAIREPLRDREVVPARHDRRADRAARCRTRPGPGTPTPMPRTSSRARPTCSSSSEKRSETQPRHASGPRAMSRSAARSASGVPARSLTATRACVAPRSATRTTPASWLKASTVGGRPPVDALPPAS